MSKKSVWVTYGRTIDNDDLQPLVWWGSKPTDAEIDAIYEPLYGVMARYNTVKASVQ